MHLPVSRWMALFLAFWYVLSAVKVALLTGRDKELITADWSRETSAVLSVDVTFSILQPKPNRLAIYRRDVGHATSSTIMINIILKGLN